MVGKIAIARKRSIVEVVVNIVFYVV